MKDLSVQLGRLNLKNPIMVASGPLTSKISLLKEAEEKGAGSVSIKHVMLEQTNRPKPRWYFERNIGIVNAGDPRLDADVGCRLVRDAKEQTELAVIANMSGVPGKLETWGILAHELEQAGADAVELNFNCPNLLSPDIKTSAQQGASLGSDPEACRIVVSEVNKAVQIPVIVKLSTDGGMLLPVAKACAEAAPGVLMTVHAGFRAAPGVDIYNGGKLLYPGAPSGNLGGYTGYWGRMLTNRYVADVAKLLPENPMIGGSGIVTWRHMIETIMYGALAVQVCTSIMHMGFDIIPGALKGISDFMEEAGYDSIAQMKGLSLQYIVPPNKMEYEDIVASIDSGKCTGCKLCTKMPTCTAIGCDASGKICAVDPDECIGCGLCIGVCPRGAVSVKPRPAVMK